MGAVRTSHVFFLGLGGIGMSALARHLKLLGHEVGGYDLTPSPLLETLSKGRHGCDSFVGAFGSALVGERRDA